MESAESEPLRVLLVEDDMAFAAVVAALVRSAYPEAVVFAVETLEAAKRIVSETDLELVITDLDIPDSAGLDTAQAVLEMVNRTPVVVLTGNAEDDLGAAAIRAGAQDYLVKDDLDRRTLQRTIRYSRERFGLTEELLVRSTHDSLTGLLNRSSLNEKLAHRLTKRAHGELVEVIFVDVDQFKQVNDIYGHSVGDQALIHVARVLERSSRSGDIVARLAGDEFVLVAQGSTSDGATSLSRRITNALSQPVTIEGAQLQLSVSLGVAIADENVTDADWLIGQADAAMYCAKRDRAYADDFPEQKDSSPSETIAASGSQRP